MLIVEANQAIRLKVKIKQITVKKVMSLKTYFLDLTVKKRKRGKIVLKNIANILV